jgi:uncharacterized protein (TIGR00251 family)
MPQDPSIHTLLPIKVVPSSSKDCLAGWLGESLKIRTQAPPERGKANTCVLKMIAQALGIPQDSITLTKGETSVNKVLSITGLTLEEIKEKIGNSCQSH